MRTEALLCLYFAAYLCADLAGALLWKWLARSGKVVAVVLQATLIAELLRNVFRDSSRPWVNKTLLSIVPIIEVVGYSYLYLLTIMARRLPRKMFLLMGLWALIICCNMMFLEPWPKAQLNLNQAESVWISLMAIHALYYLSISAKATELTRTPGFWFWAMILIYQCSTISFWGGMKVWKTLSEPTQLLIADVQVLLNIIQYAGMAYGFTLYKPKTTTVG